MALFLFGIPFGVSAGLLSFVSSLFSSVSAEEVVVENSQTIPLLQSSLNSDPDPLSDDSSVTILNGTALLADDGPTGGLAENKKDHPTSDTISIYVVRKGDSLATIARMFGVSVNTIRWSNDISGSTISPGQTLVILPVSGVRHIVKKGDTVASITKAYKGDLEEVKRYNNIVENTKLAVGDIVIVPDGEIISQGSKNGGARTKAIISSKEFAGYYLRPTSGKRTQGIHGYNAVDIAPQIGTPIVAAADGQVIVSKTSGWNGGYGLYIVIQHNNGTQTLYAHNQENVVVVGQSVKQGEVIAYVGRTGKVTGPHLHFEVRGAKNPF